LHHGLQLLAQLVQVHLLAKRCTEGCHDPGAVILAAIEAPINNALAQGLEQGAGRPAPCSYPLCNIAELI
jgi:hypothetical protein